MREMGEGRGVRKSLLKYGAETKVKENVSFLTLRAVPLGLTPNQCPANCFPHNHWARLKFNELHIKVGQINPVKHFDIQVLQVQSVRILQISTSGPKRMNILGEREKSHCSASVMLPKNVLKSCISRSSRISTSARYVLSRLKTLSLIDRSCHVDTGLPSASFRILYWYRTRRQLVSPNLQYHM